LWRLAIRRSAAVILGNEGENAGVTAAALPVMA